MDYSFSQLAVCPHIFLFLGRCSKYPWLEIDGNFIGLCFSSLACPRLAGVVTVFCPPDPCVDPMTENCCWFSV